jgi:hypothetical protein
MKRTLDWQQGKPCNGVVYYVDTRFMHGDVLVKMSICRITIGGVDSYELWVKRSKVNGKVIDSEQLIGFETKLAAAQRAEEIRRERFKVADEVD